MSTTRRPQIHELLLAALVIILLGFAVSSCGASSSLNAVEPGDFLPDYLEIGYMQGDSSLSHPRPALDTFDGQSESMGVTLGWNLTRPPVARVDWGPLLPVLEDMRSAIAAAAPVSPSGGTNSPQGLSAEQKALGAVAVLIAVLAALHKFGLIPGLSKDH